MRNPISVYRGLTPGWKLALGLMLSAAIFVVSWKLGSHEGMLIAAANPVTNLTLADIVRQEAPNGGLLPIIEALSKLTPALQTITWSKANNGTFHRINRRTALPAPIRRRINKGVPATVSGTQQVDEVTTMLADKSVIDATLIRMNGPESRAREVAAHMMGLEQQVESDLLIGSIGTDPDGIDGIETRLNASTNVPGGNQVVKVDALRWAPTSSRSSSPASRTTRCTASTRRARRWSRASCTTTSGWCRTAARTARTPSRPSSTTSSGTTASRSRTSATSRAR
jgi:hypothetical protein